MQIDLNFPSKTMIYMCSLIKLTPKYSGSSVECRVLDLSLYYYLQLHIKHIEAKEQQK